MVAKWILQEYCVMGTVSTISKDDACREQESMKRPEFSPCDSINYRFSPS